MRTKAIISFLLFFLTFLLLNINSNKEFSGVHDWNGARNGNIARNYLRYGLLETKLGQTENSGKVSKEDFKYYTHFPPTLTLLMAASFKAFGVTEWAGRLIPILATSGVIVLIFLIGELLFDWEIGLLAALLSLATPMVLYFGKNPAQEPLVVFFVLLSYFGFLNLSKGKKYKVIFVGGLILAQLTTWAGFFLIPALTLVRVLKKDIQGVKKLIPFWILSVALFIVYLFYVRSLTGSFTGGGLFDALLQRSGISEMGKIENLNLLTYLNQMRLWYTTLFTLTLCLLSSLWLISKVAIRKFTDKELGILTLGIFGITYSLIFINSSYIHNYLIFYMLPFISLASASMFNIFVERFSVRNYRWIFFITLILIVFLERFEFTKALIQSEPDKFSVEVGKFINANTKASETVTVQSDRVFWETSENFLKFYGDRRFVFSQDNDSGTVLKVDYKKQTYKLIR